MRGTILFLLCLGVFSYSHVSLSQTPSNVFLINTSVVGKGAITPSGQVSVAPGGNQSFSITPAPGYSLATVFLDGNIVESTSTIELNNIQGNHSITASFFRSSARPVPIPTGGNNPSGGNKSFSVGIEFFNSQINSFITKVFSTATSPSSPKTALSNSALTFGGRITAIIPCTCTPKIKQIVVGPPNGGNFLITPGSKIYDYERISPGIWVLGDYSPGGVCAIRISGECVPKPTKGTVIKIGTS